MTTMEKVRVIYHAIDEKLGVNIKVIDISEITVLADYLVIAGGNNKNQVQTIADYVAEKLAEQNISTSHVEGYASANWILLDYGDIIVHIFNQEDRLFYDLERLWQDGKTVEVEGK